MKKKWIQAWNELCVLAVHHPEIVVYAARLFSMVYGLLD